MRLASPRPRKGEAPFDRWSWAHLASGLLLGVLPFPWYALAGLLAAYDLAEGGLRRIKMEEGGVFEYESWPNIAADVALGLAGIAAVKLALALAWAGP